MLIKELPPVNRGEIRMFETPVALPTLSGPPVPRVPVSVVVAPATVAPTVVAAATVAPTAVVTPAPTVAATVAPTAASSSSAAASTKVPDEEEVDDELIAALTSVTVDATDSGATETKATPTPAPDCQSVMLWNQQMAQYNKELAKLNLAVAQCDNKFCRSAVFRAMRAVHTDMAAFRKRCGSSVLGNAAKAAYNKIVTRYYRMLRTQLRQCSSVKCQRQFVRRFRIDLESRQIALFRQLSRQTAAKLEQDKRACNARTDFTDAMRATCVRLVTEKAAIRQAKLEVRRLRLAKRRNLRACDVTVDPVSCKAAVEREFKADLVKIMAVISPPLTSAPGASSARSAIGAASALSVSSILAVVLVIALAI